MTKQLPVSCYQSRKIVKITIERLGFGPEKIITKTIYNILTKEIKEYYTCLIKTEGITKHFVAHKYSSILKKKMVKEI